MWSMTQNNMKQTKIAEIEGLKIKVVMDEGLFELHLDKGLLSKTGMLELVNWLNNEVNPKEQVPNILPLHPPGARNVDSVLDNREFTNSLDKGLKYEEKKGNFGSIRVPK